MNSAGTPARFLYTAVAATFFAYATVVVSAYARAPEHLEAWQSAAPTQGSPVGGVSPALHYLQRPWQPRVHPFLAGALMLIVARLIYLAWQQAPRRASSELLVSILVLALLCAVALPDAYARLNVQPWALLLQVLATLTVLSLLWWLVLRGQTLWPSAEESAFTRSLRPRAAVVLLLVVAEIGLGAWSNVSHAGLPCGDFPTCGGRWWPSVDLADAFAASRLTQAIAASEPTEAATGIHLLHRLGGLITLLYLGWLAMHVFWRDAEGKVCRYGVVLAAALLAQTSLGVMAVVMGLPTAIAVAHSAVGALLLLLVVTFYHALHPPRQKLNTSTNAR